MRNEGIVVGKFDEPFAAQHEATRMVTDEDGNQYLAAQVSGAFWAQGPVVCVADGLLFDPALLKRAGLERGRGYPFAAGLRFEVLWSMDGCSVILVPSEPRPGRPSLTKYSHGPRGRRRTPNGLVAAYRIRGPLWQVMRSSFGASKVVMAAATSNTGSLRLFLPKKVSAAEYAALVAAAEDKTRAKSSVRRAATKK